MDPPSRNASSRRPLLHRAPLVPVAIALTAGIVAGRYLPFPLFFWTACSFASFVVALATFRRRHLHLATSAAVAVVIGAIGAVHLRMAYFALPSDHVVTYTGRSPILATLRGRIVTAPQITGAGGGGDFAYARPPRTSFLLDARSLRTDPPDDGEGAGESRTPTSGLVRVRIDEPNRRLSAGQDVRLVGWIGRYRAPSNPGECDVARSARANRTLVWMSVPSARGATILAGESRPWHARAYWHVRAAARQHLTACADRDEGRLLGAMILGERHQSLSSLNRTMVRAGLAHFLSISGLHLGVFLAFVFGLCRLCMLSPRRSAIAVLAVLAAYVLLAEPRAPLLRSAIMAACLCAAVILRRRHMTLNALALAAIVLLAIDPLQLFSAGFQLSFAIVVGIVLLYRPVRDWLFSRWIRRRGLTVFRGERAWRHWLSFTVANRVMDLVAVCLVAYMTAVPLVAYHFGLFSPYAPLLSLLVLPLVLCVLVSGYVTVALAWPLPNLSYFVGRGASAAAGWLESAVSLLERLPGLSFELRPVGCVWVVLCYAAIVLVAIRRRLPLGRLWAASAVLLLAILTFWSQRPAPAPVSAELNILAVGSGQCALLRTPDGRTYLLDAGSMGGFDLHARTLGPFLRHERLPAPEAAFVSHANTDHFNAIPAVLSHGSLRRTYLNDYFGAGPDPPGAEARMMQLFEDSGVEVLRLRAGREVALDERTTVEVLWPPAEKRDDLSVNDTSLVLRITCDGKSVLVTGDLDSQGQLALATGGQSDRLRSDILVLPHHGGWETTLPEFFEAVAPRVVLVSSARDPIGPTNSPRAREFYARIKRSREYYCTARTGWVQVRFGREGIEVKTMR